MRKWFNLHAVLMLAGGLLVTRSLPAQEPTDSQEGHSPMDHGMMGMMSMTDMMSMMGDCPMMAAARQGPRAALAQRKELGLTDSQVTRLETLAAREKQAQAKPLARMRTLHKELVALTNREQLDSIAVRGVLERMGSLHTDMGLAMLRAQQETRLVLSPDQRQMFAKRAKETMGMGGGMMGGGMMGAEGNGMQGCPMMHDSTNAPPGTSQPTRPSQTMPALPPPGDHHGHEPSAAPS